jgi:F-box-like
VQIEVLTHILSHLPAASLSSVSLVSHRFLQLVTTPHAWRIAFSRYFPAQDAIGNDPATPANRGSDREACENLRAEKRFFTRLTGLASWRSEYILRTRLLRSLTRGKPSQTAPSLGSSSRPNSAANNANAVVTYSSHLSAPVNHIHGTFSNGKKPPRFIHGADEVGYASTSDPSISKVDNWGLSDILSFPQFAEIFPGDPLYGLGDGLVGVPNVMDVSQPFGLIYGEGFPGGGAYFRPSDELRGRFLVTLPSQSEPQLGIPKIADNTEAISAVWIAKSPAVPSVTDGLVGIMTGSSCGIVTAYSLGADNLRDNRIGKGEITARWALSPGVPIITISVDESYSTKRKAAGRIWAVVLNALGEVFCLSQSLQRAPVEKGAKLDLRGIERLAWETGRNVYWNLVEPTRRVAHDDPYQEAEFDGSYSPRSSSKNMNLSKEQLIAETREIEKFLSFRSVHFRKVCDGWDMRRRMEVDFAGDDGKGAGENIVVIGCGIGEGTRALVKRFTRLNSEQASFDDYPVPKTPPVSPNPTTMASLFGGGSIANTIKPKNSNMPPKRSISPTSRGSLDILVEEWRTSILSLNYQHPISITTSAVDLSTYSLLRATEDPLLTLNGNPSMSYPLAAPLEHRPHTSSHIPGHRARFLAVGTNNGTVTVWNIRGPHSSNSTIVNELQSLRTIHTDSPQISCLALSALYIVHGGNDGLVQTWDPLASTLQPLRTLNSRFSSRARRRLVQAEASIHGVGVNMFAAGAIVLDPDPTVLRGMVSLGTHLRYWSYSSTTTDQYSGKKRRLRRSGERGNNSGPDRFTSTGRGALMDYIAIEQEELKKEKERRAREESRLRGRFGVGLGGLSDEEVLRYAKMISQEEFQKAQERRTSDTECLPDGDYASSQGHSECTSDTVTPEGSISEYVSSPMYKTEDEFDRDLEEAIRLSLLDGVDDGGCSPRASGSGEYDISIKFKQKKNKRSASSSSSTSQASKTRAKDSVNREFREAAADNLGYTQHNSSVEEQNRLEGSGDDFPELTNGQKGKGKQRAS